MNNPYPPVSQWYRVSDNKVVGPETEQEVLKLREEGAISDGTLLATTPDGSWRAFSEIQELASRFPRTELTRATPPPLHPRPDLTQAHHCPFCQEPIQRQAKKCKHCGEFLDPLLRAASTPKEGNTQIIVQGGSAAASSSASAAADADADAKSEASDGTDDGCFGCGCWLLILCIIGAIAIAVIEGVQSHSKDESPKVEEPASPGSD